MSENFNVKAVSVVIEFIVANANHKLQYGYQLHPAADRNALEVKFSILKSL